MLDSIVNGAFNGVMAVGNAIEWFEENPIGALIVFLTGLVVGVHIGRGA